MFKEIKFQKEDFSDYKCERENIIDHLSKINIVIGANNSGKSRLIRQLFSSTGYHFIHKNIDTEELHNGIAAAVSDVKKMFQSRYRGNPLLITNRIEQLYDKLFLSLTNSPRDDFERVISHLFDISGIPTHDFYGTQIKNPQTGQMQATNLGILI
jgi:AAA15 family ATPase/GTPase